MSGRKQHFIPQSLLRGFSRKGKGSKQQVVAYTYDRGIFTAATDGVGAERNFYSELDVEGKTQTLDDKITDFETPLADVLVGLRALPHRASAETLQAATFVTHLTVRNDHFRKSVSTGGAALFHRFQSSMSDEQTAKALMGLGGNSPSDFFRNAMKKPIADYAAMFAAMGLSEDQIIEWAFAYAKANFSEFHRALVVPMQASFDSFSEPKILEIAADAQRRALETGLSPQAWIDRLSEMDWHVLHSDVSLILPDCVSIAVGNSGTPSPLMLAERDEVEAILLPIASDRLLVGSREDRAIPLFDLNAAFAACSWDFFVGFDRTNEFEALRDSIRTGVQKQMDDLVSEALNESVHKQTTKNSGV
ncbi:DUF4238 domain-containing protein [Erythrobacter sp. W302b]|uniref:DUF4238 domain-containing protein n=1 Tax=Erythrobacter sp. W302b TaxID=3389874 RepID=UPI00396B34A6